MKWCPRCQSYAKLSAWPMIKGKPYTYCRECKRQLQRDWVNKKRRISSVDHKYY